MSDIEVKKQILKQKSIDLMKNFDPNIPLIEQMKQKGLMEYLNIFVDDLEYPSRQKIGVRHLYQEPDLRLSIFCLPKGSVMKLHDHPTMKVACYILEGSMEARIFNKQKYMNGDKNLYRMEMRRLKKNEIALIEGDEDNFHEFVGGQDSCKFLDIIFPDYDDVHRTLKFYKYDKVGENHEGTDLYQLTEEQNYERDIVYL